MHNGGEARQPPEAWEEVGQYQRPIYQPSFQPSYQPLYQPLYQPQQPQQLAACQPWRGSQPVQAPPYLQLQHQTLQYQLPSPLQPQSSAQSEWQSQASCPPSGQTTYQVSYPSYQQPDCQPLFSRQWGNDLYSMTELALGEVSIADPNCPVCQRDQHLTRHRGSREASHLLDPRQKGGPSQNQTTADDRVATADASSRILVSSNSSLAAIYIDVKFFPAAATAATAKAAAVSGGGGGSGGGVSGDSDGGGAHVSGAAASSMVASRDEQLTSPGIRGELQAQGATTSSVTGSTPSLRRPAGRNRVAEASAVAAAAAAATSAPPSRSRDVTALSAAEGSSEGSPYSAKVGAELEGRAAGTPGPWTSVSESLGTPTTSVVGQAAEGVVQGAEAGTPGSGGSPGQPYKTTIQLLRFTDKDIGQSGTVQPPRRLQPPLFLSRHRLENVVTGRTKRLAQQQQQPPPPLQTERENFSNSVDAAAESLLPSARADRQKQLVANAIHLTRLIESSWAPL